MQKLLEETDLFEDTINSDAFQYGEKWSIIEKNVKKIISRDNGNINGSPKQSLRKKNLTKSYMSCKIGVKAISPPRKDEQTNNSGNKNMFLIQEGQKIKGSSVQNSNYQNQMKIQNRQRKSRTSSIKKLQKQLVESDKEYFKPQKQIQSLYRTNSLNKSTKKLYLTCQQTQNIKQEKSRYKNVAKNEELTGILRIKRPNHLQRHNLGAQNKTQKITFSISTQKNQKQSLQYSRNIQSITQAKQSSPIVRYGIQSNNKKQKPFLLRRSSIQQKQTERSNSNEMLKTSDKSENNLTQRNDFQKYQKQISQNLLKQKIKVNLKNGNSSHNIDKLKSKSVQCQFSSHLQQIPTKSSHPAKIVYQDTHSISNRLNLQQTYTNYPMKSIHKASNFKSPGEYKNQIQDLKQILFKAQLKQPQHIEKKQKDKSKQNKIVNNFEQINLPKIINTSIYSKRVNTILESEKQNLCSSQINTSKTSKLRAQSHNISRQETDAHKINILEEDLVILQDTKYKNLLLENKKSHFYKEQNNDYLHKDNKQNQTIQVRKIRLSSVLSGQFNKKQFALSQQKPKRQINSKSCHFSPKTCQQNMIQKKIHKSLSLTSKIQQKCSQNNQKLINLQRNSIKGQQSTINPSNQPSNQQRQKKQISYSRQASNKNLILIKKNLDAEKNIFLIKLSLNKNKNKLVLIKR